MVSKYGTVFQIAISLVVDGFDVKRFFNSAFIAAYYPLESTIDEGVALGPDHHQCR